jgi:hypothetical protein
MRVLKVRDMYRRLIVMNLSCSFCIILLVWLIPGSVEAFGQTSQSAIFGRASDPKGAMLPGVRVTATNLENGAMSHATTNDEGAYVIPSLLPGRYRVNAEANGFTQQTLPALDLLVDARSEVDFSLQIAGIVTNVTVTSAVPAVDTGSASIGQVIEEKTIRDLPLNGRDFLQLVLLSAGASPTAAGADVTTFNEQSVNISGGRESSNQFMLDGVFNNTIHFEGLNIQPSIDAIQEFKVLRNTLPAEFGHGTAIVDLITKSGGTRFHGTLYEFLRNDVLDSRQYFDTAKPPYRQNQFGGTLGGPLSHHTFFFGGYEGFRSLQAITVLSTLPTAQMLSGNFVGSSPVTDPQTGMPFPGNIIPSIRFSAITKRMLPFLPAVTAGGGNNYVAAPSTLNDLNQYNIRIDHQFTDRDSIFGRYSIGTVNLYTPGLIPLTGLTVSDKPVNATVQWTHIFLPTLLNNALIGFNRNYQQRIQDGANNPSLNLLQFSNAINSPINFGFPTVILAGYNAFGTSLSLPELVGGNTFQYGDTLTWVKGRNTYKFGLDIRNTQMPHTPYLASRGEFAFEGTSTGNPVADFLLGLPFISVGGGKGPTAFMSMLGTSFFAQDDFIVSRRLTLNLGLRYDRLSALSDRTRGRLGVFDPVRGVVVPPADVEKDGLVNPDDTNVGPRLGFSWQPFADGKTAVRGGYGIYYDQKPLNEYNFSLGTELTYQELVGTQEWDTLFPAAAGSPPGILSDDPYARTPRVQQYSLGIQHELPWEMTLEAAYAGQKSVHANGRSDLNQARLEAYPGEPLANRRPYPNYASIYAVNDSDYANYNSLQSTLQKRASRNLFFLAAYTYSKSLDIQSSAGDVMQNAHNILAEYAPSDFNQTNHFSFSSNYVLPFGHGQRYGAGAGGAMDRLIGGYQLNGIYTYSTGNPFSVAVAGVDRSNTGTFSGGLQRANLTGAGGGISGPHIVNEWFNTNAFVVAPENTFGNSSRNLLDGPPINNLDFSLIKVMPIVEGVKLDFRAELFNILNHPQFELPVSDPTNPAFGQLNAVRAAREIQFALKLNF